MRKFWTKEEDDLIKGAIGKMTFKEMQSNLLPHRTAEAINFHANEILKLFNPLKRKYFHDEDFWSIPNKLNAYYSGICMADASINDHACKSGNTKYFIWNMSQVDLSLMRQFSKDIKYTGPIKLSERKTRTGYLSKFARIKINCQKWCHDLETIWNIVPRKTSIIKPPAIDDKLLDHFLRGYLDGDGSIHVSHFKTLRKSGKIYRRDNLIIQFVSASKEIIKWIKDYTERKFFADGRADLPKIYESANYSQYHVCGQRAVQMFLYLSKLDCPCLDRKWKNPAVLALVKQKISENPKVYAEFI